MNERRISQRPTEPARCPVCLGVLDRRGVCRECGHSFEPPTPFAVPALRRLALDRGPRWSENPAFFIVGLFALLPYACFAYRFPYILVPFAFLLIAAGIRTLRLAILLSPHESGSPLPRLCGGIVESFGVASIAGTAAVVAFACVQLGLPGGNSISSPLYISVLALVAASVVFLVLFVLLWPRGRSGDHPPDPED